MSANTIPIFPGSILLGIAGLTAATAVTARTDITGTTGLVQLVPVQANAGARIDSIRVKSKASVASAGLVGIWLYDGTTSRLLDEIPVTVVTASNTVDSFAVERSYTNLNLGPTHQLYISETVVNDLTVFAFGGAF